MTSERNAILDEARSTFAFLPALRPPDLDESANSSVLAYKLSTIYVEVEFDWREGAVFVLIVRPIDGARPGGYYMAGGQRVRRHLHELLPIDGPQAKRLRAAAGKSGPNAMLAQLAASGVALRQVIDREDISHLAFPDAQGGGQPWKIPGV